MKAMLLAAGEGTRLRPLTLDLPKVLAPLDGVPMLQFTLSWLRSHGITEVAINLYHLGERIADFCGDGSRFGVSITYSKEGKILGTAGGVKRMEGFFDNTFIVVYGDILTDLSISQMLKFHKLKQGLATVAVQKVAHPRQAGIVCLNQDERIIDFVEKPKSGGRSGELASAAIYILERSVLDYIPENSYSDFGYNIFPRLISSGVRIYGYVLSHNEYFIDIGSWEHYRQAIEDVKAGKVKVIP